jgi:hypothetical protein
MSNNYWDDEEDEDDTTPDAQLDGSDLLKKLRKAKRADEKRIKELTEQLDGLSKGQRERLVKEVLEKQGVNLKVAKFVPQDIEVSEDAISLWLDENAEIFGYESVQQEVNQDDVRNMRDMDSVTSGANSPTASDDVESRLKNATTQEEVLSILAGN